MGWHEQDVESAAAKFAKEFPSAGLISCEATVKPIGGAAREAAAAVAIRVTGIDSPPPVADAPATVVEEAFGRSASQHRI